MHCWLPYKDKLLIWLIFASPLKKRADNNNMGKVFTEQKPCLFLSGIIHDWHSVLFVDRAEHPGIDPTLRKPSEPYTSTVLFYLPCSLK